MNYLTAEQILLIHSIIIAETGGAHGLRDRHALLTLVELPKQKVFNKELYPTVFLKAALYARNIIKNHPFVDGNKRTGMVAASVFLVDNGHKITAKEGAIEKFGLKVATENLSLETIAEWFKRHSKKR